MENKNLTEEEERLFWKKIHDGILKMKKEGRLKEIDFPKNPDRGLSYEDDGE